MKNLNTLLRRLMALLLCACMLLGHMSVALSAIPDVLSPYVPLMKSTGPRSAAQQTVALSVYADVNPSLKANAKGDPLPDTVGEGQPLFFRLGFDLYTADGNYTLRQAYANGEIDEKTIFTCNIDFLHLLANSKYPTSPNSPDNIAMSGSTKIFRWWVENNQICLQFFDDILTGSGKVSNTSLGFEGELVLSGKNDDGNLNFGVDGEITTLIAKQEYGLTKEAGIPYYDAKTGSYLVDYTVKLTLENNMKLDSSLTGKLYCAALTLVDTVAANGALTGTILENTKTILDNIVVTAPEEETAVAVVSNNENSSTITLSSPDQILEKGLYTIVYKMKVDDYAAFVKLKDYTEEQKKNTVELKENGNSLKQPLVATATISWEDVTENKYKIDKGAFTDKGSYYNGVYLYENGEEKKYGIDFRVVVYIREPVETFTVTDKVNFSLSFANAPTAPKLEGVDVSADYWNNDISTATFKTYTESEAPTLTSSIVNGAWEITLKAPQGQKLEPGAYHLRVPAEVTALNNVIGGRDYQHYQNTAYLTSVDGKPTNENDFYKSVINGPIKPTKAGAYETADDGTLLLHNNKPVIRWDVYAGWDFYSTTIFEDTLEGMELLIGGGYSFDIHSMNAVGDTKQTLVQLYSAVDTDYLDFKDNGFTFNSEKLATNSDGSPVKLYKFVYFTVPKVDKNSPTGYVTSGLNNKYSATFKPAQGGQIGPIEGEAQPTLTNSARLFVKKEHVIEINDSLTKWKIVCENTNNIPFALLKDLDIVDVVPRGQEPIGEVNVHYSDERPITVEMVCDNNEKIQLVEGTVEGTHYTIRKEHSEYDFGTDGKYGFAVDLNMKAVADALKEKGATYFKTITVYCYLENATHPSGQNYRIKNDGCLYYSNQGQVMKEAINGFYDRGFATKRKGVETYGDRYDPNAHREYYVCGKNGATWQAFTGGYDDDPTTGDGQKEIVWRIFIGAREFGNDNNPITVTVTDTFSENQMFPTYEGKTTKDLFLIRAEDAMDYIIIPDSVVTNGNSFTLTFTVPGGGWAANDKNKSKDIYIYYHTILKPEAIKEAVNGAPQGQETVIVEYDNTANVGWNGGSYDIPTSTGKTSFSTSMLDKTSERIDSVSEIEYTIRINDERLLLNGGKPLVLTDTLEDGKEYFVYRNETLTLKNLDTNTVMTVGPTVTASTYTLSWGVGENKGFTIGVPDGQRLELTYRVEPQLEIGSTTPILKNTASLNGKGTTDEEKGFQVNAAYQQGEYKPPIGEAKVKIIKQDKFYGYAIPLNGVTFNAYEVDANGDCSSEPYASVVTGPDDTCEPKTGDGEAVFTFTRNGDFDYDKVYCIKEAQPLPGYQPCNDEWYFYFSVGNEEFANAEVAALVTELRKDGKVIRGYDQKVSELYVDNIPYTGELRIYKQSTENEPLGDAVFTLMDQTENPSSYPSTKVTENGVTYLEFKNLKSGTYTLTETNPPKGYKLGTINSWTIVLDVNDQDTDGEKSVSVSWPDGTPDTVKSYVKSYVVEMPNKAVPSLTVLNDQADDTQFAIPVTKKLDGAETAGDQAFTFTLSAVTANAPMPTEPTDTHATTSGATYANAQTTVSFGEITYTCDDLGKEYIYRITEDALEGSTCFTGDSTVYQVTVQVQWLNDQLDANIKSIVKVDENGQQIGDAVDQVQFVNAYSPETTSITIKKVWDDNGDQDGKRDTKVTVQLTADGQNSGNPVELSEANSWTHTFENLPAKANGKEIVYAVVETAVPEGYEVSYSKNGTEITVTNTHTPATTEATVKKVWSDANNQDGKRPLNLVVTLSNGTENVGTVTLDEANKWTGTITGLPKYAAGQEITYTWTEGALPEGYTLTNTKIEGTVTTLTNSYTPELTEATVTKVWDDADDQDDKRPEQLTVTLNNGTKDVGTVTLNEANQWTDTISGLPKYAAGKEIEYTWSEGTLPEGYTLKSTKTEGTITTITNTHETATTEATVKKVWEDEDDQDGKRPEELTVTLNNGTKDVGTVTLNEANQWTDTISDLPKYAAGQEIVYTWTEDEEGLPEGYALSNTSVNGIVTTLTNSYTPEVTEATVVKVWEDEDDQDGKRPETLKVTLSDGAEVELNEGNGWSATIENLPKFANGTAITYTWTEDVLPEGYTLTDTSVSGAITTLTNTHIPETVDVSGSKVWIDLNNAHHTRPESITSGCTRMVQRSPARKPTRITTGVGISKICPSTKWAMKWFTPSARMRFPAM
ncbi:MAG: Cna B-type domain-containing protein [Clostridia bacterium]|nr:Cna B-type domain-containing protein [Clostridia bacterium]